MPRYFFHVRDSVVLRDETGTELADDDAARTEAVRLLAGMVNDHAEDFWNEGRWTVEVRDADDASIGSLDFLGRLPIH
jgi:hypothetical protein